MAIRDVLQAVQQAITDCFPPGISAVTPSAGATGSVTLDPSSVALGSFSGLLQVVTSGPVGTATAQTSLDGGQNFGAPFTVQAQLAVFLDPSQAPSGLVLNFSGSFTASNSYSFTAAGTIEFQTGEQWLAEQTIFPRVVWIPLGDDFSSGSDFSLTQTQSTSPRAIYMASARFEAHCWGIDDQRAELLRDQVLNGFRAAAIASIRVLSGDWTRNNGEINMAGRGYVLTWSVPKPVTELAPTYVYAGPPLTEELTEEIDLQNGQSQQVTT